MAGHCNNVILAFGRVRWEHHKLETRLDYTARCCVRNKIQQNIQHTTQTAQNTIIKQHKAQHSTAQVWPTLYFFPFNNLFFLSLSVCPSISLCFCVYVNVYVCMRMCVQASAEEENLGSVSSLLLPCDPRDGTQDVKYAWRTFPCQPDPWSMPLQS